jgi:hypothetical protein
LPSIGSVLARTLGELLVRSFLVWEAERLVYRMAVPAVAAGLTAEILRGVHPRATGSGAAATLQRTLGHEIRDALQTGLDDALRHSPLKARVRVSFR